MRSNHVLTCLAVVLCLLPLAAVAGQPSQQSAAQGEEPRPQLWQELTLTYPDGFGGTVIASFQRDQDSKLSSVTVRAGHQSYRVPGSDFAFVKYPLFDHITATTEHFKGTISVTLIVPYYERYNDAGKAEPKFAWITVLDMKSHRVQ